MQPRRFLLLGVAVAAGEAALAGVLSATVLGPYFAACAAVTGALAVGGARLLASDAPREPPPGGTDPDRDPDPPPWWPGPEDLDPAGERLDDAHEDARLAVPG